MIAAPMKVRAHIPVFADQQKYLSSTARYTGIFAGYGFGKTVLQVMKAVQLAKRYPRRMGAISEPTYTIVDDTLIPAIEEFCTKYRVRYIIRGGGSPFWYLPEWGVKVLLRTMKNPGQIVGANLAWALIDELDILKYNDAKTAFRNVCNRVRKSKESPVGVATTPEGFGFCYSMWGDGQNKSDAYYAIHADARQNIYLPPNYFTDRLHNYSKAMIDAYVRGIFTNLTGGRPYYAYERKVNSAVPQLYNPRLPIEFSFDFNVNPMSATISQSEGNILRGIGEAIIPGSNTDEMCEELCRRYSTHQQLVYLYGDSSGQNLHSSSRGWTDHLIILEWMERAFPNKVVNCFAAANPFRRDRYQAVNGKWCNHEGEVTAYTDPSMTQLNHEMETLGYKPDTGIIDDLGGKVGHVSDAWGYRVMADWPVIKSITASN